ncbi:hypothetical protein CEP45_02570 [Mergibacter septicus]|nr:hypothetical protein CEP45_02570 [Mergibacter septicus]
MLWNILFVHLIGLMTPGPDFFYITKTSTGSSRRNAICAVVGITIGVCFWAASAILGLAILLHKNPELHGIIVLLGGSYLTYIGSKMLRSKQKVVFSALTEVEINRQTSWWHEIIKGLMVNLSNAKVVIYFSSVMSLYLSGLNGIEQILIVFFLIIVETFLYFYLVVILFSHKIAKHLYATYSLWLDRFAGIVFSCFGGYLIYTAYGYFTL